MKIFGVLVLMLASVASLAKNDAVEVVGVPPSDAARGLVRVSKNEIRHYCGNKKEKVYLVSKDNGQTWKQAKAGESYPPNFGGITKESPAITRNPLTGEFIRVQPIRGYVFISKGGIDGKWLAVTKDGKLSDSWQKGDTDNLLTLSGIMRNPTFVNKGKRILIPAHGGSAYVHISDDGGLTWRKSKNGVRAPGHDIGGVHKGRRWQNGGVEGTIVELKDGRLWIIVRTSQDQHYESFSTDYGETWSEAKPSRFYGTLTMPTIGRLKDGRLLMLWTNTTALPECYRSNREWMTEKGYKPKGGEDAFTNRDSHHAAISNDDGKTWHGFREIILDEHRNAEDYATRHGSEDRGKHQSEFIQVDKKKVLISLGQHSQHRRLVIMDTSWLYGKKRMSDFSNGLEEWTHHSYKPVVRGHCAYHRKPGAFLVDHPKSSGKKVLNVRRVTDAELVNEKYEVNYEKGGATWNFPNGEKGSLTVKFMMQKGSGGTQMSLVDRLFNGCDETTEKFAMYSLNLKPGKKVGSKTLQAGKWYTLTFRWDGVKDQAKNKCKVYLNGSKRPIASLKLANTSPNGLSYVHFISTAEKEDQGILVEYVKAAVK